MRGVGDGAWSVALAFVLWAAACGGERGDWVEEQRFANIPRSGKRVVSGRVDCPDCEGEIQVTVAELRFELTGSPIIREIVWIEEPWRFRIDRLPEKASLSIQARWDPGDTVSWGPPLPSSRLMQIEPFPPGSEPIEGIELALLTAGQVKVRPGGGESERRATPPSPLKLVDEPEGLRVRTLTGTIECAACTGSLAVFLSAVPVEDPLSTEVDARVFLHSGEEFSFGGVIATREFFLGARWDADGEPGRGPPGPEDHFTVRPIPALGLDEEQLPLAIDLMSAW